MQSQGQNSIPSRTGQIDKHACVQSSISSDARSHLRRNWGAAFGVIPCWCLSLVPSAALREHERATNKTTVLSCGTKRFCPKCRARNTCSAHQRRLLGTVLSLVNRSYAKRDGMQHLLDYTNRCAFGARSLSPHRHLDYTFAASSLSLYQSNHALRLIHLSSLLPSVTAELSSTL